MAIKDRLVALNALRRLIGKKPLKSWKESAKKIEAQISKLKTDVNMDGIDDPKYAAPEPPKPDLPKATPVRLKQSLPKKAVVKPQHKASIDDSDVGRSRQTGIGAIVKPLIHEGLSNSEIFDLVMKKHPTLLCTQVDGEWKPTKKWYISWYRGDLRRRGLLSN